MIHEIVYYTCDYCNKNLTESKLVDKDGIGSIIDDAFPSSETIDICDSLKCYQNHLTAVVNEMLEDDRNISVFYMLDVLNDEIELDYEYIGEKFKVKWSSDDKWHKYKKETLVKLLIPYYEKYIISGNDKYIKL